MMTTRCMAAGSKAGARQRADHRPFSAAAGGGGCRRSPQHRLGWDPGLEEAALALVAVAPVGGAQHPPAAPVERPAPQAVAFKGQQEIEGKETKPDPALIEDPRQSHSLDTAIGDEIAEERPPQPVKQQPQGAKQGRAPGEAILDENETFGTVDAVGGGVRRLVHGEGLHGCPGSGNKVAFYALAVALASALREPSYGAAGSRARPARMATGASDVPPRPP